MTCVGNHCTLASHQVEEWDMDLTPRCFAHHQKQNSPSIQPRPFESKILSQRYPTNSDQIRIDGYNNDVGEGKPFQYRQQSLHKKDDTNSEVTAH